MSERLTFDLCVCYAMCVFQRNVKEIIDANGVRTLVELLTVAHLHISRATVPMQVCATVYKFLKQDFITS